MDTSVFVIRMATIFLAIAIMAGTGTGQIYWKKDLHLGNSDVVNAIMATADGNFILAESRVSPGAFTTDICLQKITPNGDALWTRAYGGEGNETAGGMAPGQDGNIVVAGSTDSHGQAVRNIYLFKVAPSGDTLWTRAYPGMEMPGTESNVWATSIQAAADGTFLVAGPRYSSITGQYDLYLLRITSGGDTLWTKTFQGSYDGDVCAAPEGSDGSFIVAASGSSAGVGGLDAFLIATDANGNSPWSRTYGGPNNDRACAIVPAGGTSFLVGGSFSPFSGDNRTEMYLFEIDANAHGESLWLRTFGGLVMIAQGINAIAPLSDGNFIVLGSSHCFSLTPQNNYFMLNVKPNGDSVWSLATGPMRTMEAVGSAATSNGDLLVIGRSCPNTDDTCYSFLMYLVNDRYAYKSVPFTFKIPVSGDSLNHGYSPLKAPSGMTVSLGGTINWTPTTDSVYMDHAEFLVSDDFGNKDTLTFNIFVNSKDHPNKTINSLSRSANSPRNNINVYQLSSREVRFLLPSGTSSLGVYDLRGQLMENISVKASRAIWQPKHATGRYFAKAIFESGEVVKGFTVVR
jgi:hypothetical protein